MKMGVFLTYNHTCLSVYMQSGCAKESGAAEARTGFLCCFTVYVSLLSGYQLGSFLTLPGGERGEKEGEIQTAGKSIQP